MEPAMGENLYRVHVELFLFLYKLFFLSFFFCLALRGEQVESKWKTLAGNKYVHRRGEALVSLCCCPAEKASVGPNKTERFGIASFFVYKVERSNRYDESARCVKSPMELCEFLFSFLLLCSSLTFSLRMYKTSAGLIMLHFIVVWSVAIISPFLHSSSFQWDAHNARLSNLVSAPLFRHSTSQFLRINIEISFWLMEMCWRRRSSVGRWRTERKKNGSRQFVVCTQTKISP